MDDVMQDLGPIERARSKATELASILRDTEEAFPPSNARVWIEGIVADIAKSDKLANAGAIISDLGAAASAFERTSATASKKARALLANKVDELLKKLPMN